jgi:hypothetical protein
MKSSTSVNVNDCWAKTAQEQERTATAMNEARRNMADILLGAGFGDTTRPRYHNSPEMHAWGGE